MGLAPEGLDATDSTGVQAGAALLSSLDVHDRLVATVARAWAGLDRSALELLAAADSGLGDTAPISQRKL